MTPDDNRKFKGDFQHTCNRLQSIIDSENMLLRRATPQTPPVELPKKGSSNFCVGKIG